MIDRLGADDVDVVIGTRFGGTGSPAAVGEAAGAADGGRLSRRSRRLA